jgi:hypothetical protein
MTTNVQKNNLECLVRKMRFHNFLRQNKQKIYSLILNLYPPNPVVPRLRKFRQAHFHKVTIFMTKVSFGSRFQS